MHRLGSLALVLGLVAFVGCKDDGKKSDTSEEKSEKKSDKKSDEKSAKDDDDGAKKGSAKGPKDADVDALLDDLGCSKDDDRAGCGCLREFGKASAFDAFGDADLSAWVGVTYGLGGPGDGKKTYFFLQIEPKRAAASAIESAGLKDEAVLDDRASARTLVPESDDEEADAKALVKAAKGGSKAPKGSGAADFVKTSKPKDGFRAMAKSKGTSVVIVEKGGKAFLRADGDRVLVVERSDSGGNFGDDKSKMPPAKLFCAELWPVK